MEKGLAHVFVLWLMPNFLNSFLLLVRVAQTLRCGYQSTQFEWWSQDVPVAGWDGETRKGWKAVLGAFLRRWPQWDVQQALSYPFCKVRKLGICSLTPVSHWLRPTPGDCGNSDVHWAELIGLWWSEEAPRLRVTSGMSGNGECPMGSGTSISTVYT